MRMSQMFGKTLRDDPSDADTAGHRLLIRAGLVAQVAAGVYSYLPMALRSMRKIENIIRDEMDAAGAQEVLMPVMQPVELWRQSGREEAFGPTLFHLQDRRERPMVLAPTHEEAVTDLVRRHVRSYRDLPINLYQIQTKLRDEARPTCRSHPCPRVPHEGRLLFRRRPGRAGRCLQQRWFRPTGTSFDAVASKS